ncbi:uncharacterized protein N7484_007121 [Penicillium longicatenatum]|uniref:uncharacterized protein n=1 Tax=Penicillium longicatenatum TaxID=1561947 RepID=UPI00254921E2|nr:uncharacterized protein N7484_007121 [Penicillium longicatenatum]KAJ5639259.1 hypothetical protein N7484_007121 [Penicillium longicatenatum]
MPGNSSYGPRRIDGGTALPADKELLNFRRIRFLLACALIPATLHHSPKYEGLDWFWKPDDGFDPRIYP